MKIIVILLFCFFLIRGGCCASEDVELDHWRQRATETKAGMSLADAEQLFPLYTPPDSDSQEFSGSFTFGLHWMRMRRVAPGIVVWIDYYTSPANNPLTGAVTVERRAIRAVAYEVASDFVCEPFSTSTFTLHGTVSRDASSASTLFR